MELPPPPPASPPPFGGGSASGVPGFGPQSGGYSPPPFFGGPTRGEAPAYATPPPPTTRSGMAVAALVCGLAGLVFFFIAIPSILGIVFGLVAGSSIRSSRGRLSGAGMARAGWILGIVGLLGFAAIIWAAATGRIGDDDDATTAAGSLKVGDCIASLPSRFIVFEFTTVDCATPHEAEVFAVVQLNENRDSVYPGDGQAQALASEACFDAFEAFVGEPYDTSVFEFYYTYPREIGWKATRGNVECLLFEPGATLTESVRGSGR